MPRKGWRVGAGRASCRGSGGPPPRPASAPASLAARSRGRTAPPASAGGPISRRPPTRPAPCPSGDRVGPADEEVAGRLALGTSLWPCSLRALHYCLPGLHW